MYMELAIVASLLASPHNPIAEREHHCLIENAIYEALGEDSRGMQAVTEVVLYRYENNYRGATSYCEVVYSPSQFSWTLMDEEDRYDYSEEDYLKAAQVVFSLVYDEVNNMLPNDTLHYLNPRHATDFSWYDSNKVVAAHGNHQFLKGVR